MKIQVLAFAGCPNREPTLELVRRVMCELGVQAELETIEVRTERDARRLRFLGSPTVLVDGVDIEPGAAWRTDHSMSCRMYGASGIPLRLLVEAALGRGAAA